MHTGEKKVAVFFVPLSNCSCKTCLNPGVCASFSSFSSSFSLCSEQGQRWPLHPHQLQQFAHLENKYAHLLFILTLFNFGYSVYDDGAYASFSDVDVGQNLPYHSPEQPTHLQNESYKLAKEAYHLLT